MTHCESYVIFSETLSLSDFFKLEIFSNFVDLTASGFVKSVFVESGVLSSLVSDANAAAAVL